MIEEILDILNKVCGIEEKICYDTELIESNILDSYAIVQMLYELEMINIELQLTQINKNDLKYPYTIAKLLI